GKPLASQGPILCLVISADELGAQRFSARGEFAEGPAQHRQVAATRGELEFGLCNDGRLPEGPKLLQETIASPPQATPPAARSVSGTSFPSLDKYAKGIKEMAEIVGVDHVSIGADQFDARGCVEDYTRWVHLIAAMLRGGFTSEETGKIAGGNYLHIFR